MVHEPCLQLLQFATHLASLLSKAPRFCALLFRKATVLDFSLCESRKTVFGPRASGSPSMELTAPHRESGGALAWRASARSGLATNTLPVWAVEPWFGVGFHYAQLSSVYGVLLYPILDGIARHARLGPRTADRAKLTNATCAQVTTFSRPTVRGVWTAASARLSLTGKVHLASFCLVCSVLLTQKPAGQY